MDKTALVTQQIIDGQTLVELLVRDGFDVKFAAWIRQTEEDRWGLYIASSLVDEDKLSEAYQLAHAALRKIHDPSLALTDVKLVSPKNRLVTELLAIQRKSSGKKALRFGGALLGGGAIEEAYIYPPLATSPAKGGPRMTSDEVTKKIVDLMQRTGVVRPTTIRLRDGSSFSGVPFGLEMSNNVVNVKFIDTATNTNRVHRVEEIAEI